MNRRCQSKGFLAHITKLAGVLIWIFLKIIGILIIFQPTGGMIWIAQVMVGVNYCRDIATRTNGSYLALIAISLCIFSIYINRTVGLIIFFIVYVCRSLFILSNSSLFISPLA